MNKFKKGDRVRILPKPGVITSLHGLTAIIDEESSGGYTPVVIVLDATNKSFFANPDDLEPLSVIPFDGSIQLAEETEADSAPYTERPE